MHQKKGAYRRNGVREYLAWITSEKQIIWWELREGEYHAIPLVDGVIKSSVFPSLWLDVSALLRNDKKGVLDILRKGLESPEHKAFSTAG